MLMVDLITEIKGINKHRYEQCVWSNKNTGAPWQSPEIFHGHYGFSSENYNLSLLQVITSYPSMLLITYRFVVTIWQQTILSTGDR